MPERLYPLIKYVNLNTQRGMIALVWTVRQAGTISYPALFKVVFGQSPTQKSETFDTNTINIQAVYTFHNVLIQLFQNNILETTQPTAINDIADLFELLKSDIDASKIELRVANHMSFIQHLFDISLTEIAMNDKPIKSHPIFGDPIDDFEHTWSDVFVIMPFRDDLTNVYDTAIKPAVEGSDLSVMRGDEFYSDKRIMDEVWTAIYRAKLCIIDCTGRNANVFYELGIAHTLGRPSILITSSIDDIPFDIRDRRIIVYENTEIGLKTLHNTLLKTITTEMSAHHGDNSVDDTQ